ncbi:MAG: DNA polymerase IV, partial [Candidatus Altiarchaeales archaeon]|nr:DNA polymerase IV [Candidatus Altiarchaeales archaeon]
VGSVATCNYLARDLGVKSGMSCVKAQKKAPECVFLPVRKDYYLRVSENIMRVLRGYADAFEQVSVDEAYLNVSSKTDFKGAAGYAASLKAAVYEKEKLTLSVGAGPNKLIAKIASSEEKPDGIKIVPPAGVEGFLSPLPVKKIPGVGPKAAGKLVSLNVHSVSDLKALSVSQLTSLFGEAWGKKFFGYARGADDSQVSERTKEQVGRMMSLKSNTKDKEEVLGVLSTLADDVHARLSSSNKSFKTVSVVFVLSDLSMKTRSKTFSSPTNRKEVILLAQKHLVDSFLSQDSSEIRRVGVTLSSLSDLGGQTSLVDY